MDVEVDRIRSCSGEVERGGGSRKPKQSRRQLQENVRAFSNVELEPNQQGSSASEQSQKLLGSKMAPTQTESMAHLLNAFNDGKAATTQKGATPSEQLQKDGTRSAESSTKTTTGTTTSTMGWKA
jgi:hypothetical protein